MRKVAEHSKIRKLWRVCKYFKIPINDQRIQELTEEQIDLMLWSDLLDDPKALSKLDNVYYDPEYDEAFEELDTDDSYKKPESEIDKYLHKFSRDFKPSKEITHDSEEVISEDNTSEIEQNIGIDDDEWEEV